MHDLRKSRKLHIFCCLIHRPPLALYFGQLHSIARRCQYRPMPDIIFEKRAGKYDTMLVLKDGAWEATDCPKQVPIPHDMFHYAVETVLARRGFMHRRAEGEGAGFRMGTTVEGEGVERLVETMQADSWSGRPDASEVTDLFHTTCAARGDEPFPLTRNDIQAIRDAIDNLSVRWAAVPTGGRMVLEL